MSLKDKILTWGSALTFNFMTSFSLGNSCLKTQTEGCLLEHQTSLLEAVPLVGQMFLVFSPGLDHIAALGRRHQTGDGDSAALCAEDQQRLMNRAGWSELLSHLCASGWHFYLGLRVNLRRAIWADGHTTQINLRTPSKPLVWSNAYKCCFFCLLYGRYYFVPSLPKHTFFKKTNNVNVYSIWVSCLVFFFFCYSPRK